MTRTEYPLPNNDPWIDAPSDLAVYAISDAAVYLDLSIHTLAKYRSRYDHFPEPGRMDGNRPRWSREQLDEFNAMHSRTKGRPRA